MAFATGKFMTDGVWWFYLFWLPDYLHKQFGMTKHDVMLPTFIVFGVAIVGSVGVALFPWRLSKKGCTLQCRMLAMFIIAICPLAVIATQYFGDVSRFGGHASILAVAMICIGAAPIRRGRPNLFTTVSDMFPKRAVGPFTASRCRGRFGWLPHGAASRFPSR